MKRRIAAGVFGVLFLMWLAGTIIIRVDPEGAERRNAAGSATVAAAIATAAAATPPTPVPSATSIPTRPPVRAPSATPAPTPRPAPGIGEEAHLDASGLEQWHLTVDDAAQSEWVSAQVARDTTGLNQMVRAGRAFPVANGTRLLVLDQNLFTTRVRVLEGPHAGRVGVVNTEHVIR